MAGLQPAHQGATIKLALERLLPGNGNSSLFSILLHAIIRIRLWLIM